MSFRFSRCLALAVLPVLLPLMARTQAPPGGKLSARAQRAGEIIAELKTGKFANVAERAGRAQDKDDGGGLETLRRDGYM